MCSHVLYVRNEPSFCTSAIHDAYSSICSALFRWLLRASADPSSSSYSPSANKQCRLPGKD